MTTIIIIGSITALTGFIWYLTTDVPLYMHMRLFFGIMTITTICSLFSDLCNGLQNTNKILKILLLCVFIVCLSLSFINH